MSERVTIPGLPGPLVAEFLRLYTWADAEQPAQAAAVAPELQPVLDRIGAVLGYECKAVGRSVAGALAGTELDPSKAVVLFSGGKDCVAAALALKAQGMRPALLHVRKINGPSYGRELQSAAAVANLIGLPLRVVAPEIKGKRTFRENPTRNLLYAAIGAQFGAYFGAGSVCLGTLEIDAQNATNFACGLSDDPLLIEAAGKAMAAILPGARILPPQHATNAAAYRRCWEHGHELLDAIGSCMTGPRAHGIARQANERKYGLQLKPGRCGSCYKCAVELVFLAGLEGEVLPPGLAAHCVAKARVGAQLIAGSAELPSAQAALDGFFGDYSAINPWPALAAWGNEKGPAG